MFTQKFVNSIKRVRQWYKKYGSDYVSIPGKEEMKRVLLLSGKTILAYFRGENGKKRRLPLMSFWLLLFLIGLNVVISVHNNIASANPATTSSSQTTNQATTSKQSQQAATTQKGNISSTSSTRLDATAPSAACPEILQGTTTTLASIIAYATFISDDNSAVNAFASNPSNNNSSVTIINTGTSVAVGGGTPTAQQQQAIQDQETNCEDAFNAGGINSNVDGSEIYVQIITLSRAASSCNIDHTDRVVAGFQDVGVKTNHELYCIYSKSNNSWIFPCSDIGNPPTPEYKEVQADWLSGDINATNADSGHFEQTQITKVPILFPAMQAIGLAILAPSIVLIGYQMLTIGSGMRMAGAMESMARVIMGAVLILVCYAAIQVILNISNTIATAIVNFHGSFPYPQPTYYNALQPGQTADSSTQKIDFGYTLGNESTTDPNSYRGIVVPITRWGCTANAFMEILGSKLGTDMAGYIPIIGNFIKAAGQIADAVELVKNAGEFIKTIMSVMLAVQIIMRLVLLNFYIMMAPIAFACWSLPGGVGPNIMRSWFKGFFAILAIQVVQLFLITVIPLLIPATLPQFPLDSTNVLNSFIHELPSIAILWAVLRVPKMMGTSATSMISSAGQMTGGAIVAVGAAAYNIV